MAVCLEEPRTRAPVVLVSGFLGPRGAKAYWGTAHDISEARVLQVDPSPVGSLHDRACEIFYQLKGGVVDYGSSAMASSATGTSTDCFQSGTNRILFILSATVMEETPFAYCSSSWRMGCFLGTRQAQDGLSVSQQ